MSPEERAARIEAGRIAGGAWFGSHPDPSSNNEWRDHYRAVLDAADKAVPVTVVDAITPRNPGESRGDRCPTCGSPVLVVAGDEGTHHYEPAGMMLLERAERAEAAARDFAEVLDRLADMHHRTLTGSKLHDPEHVEYRDCICKTCASVTRVLAAHPGWENDPKEPKP